VSAFPTVASPSHATCFTHPNLVCHLGARSTNLDTPSGTLTRASVPMAEVVSRSQAGGGFAHMRTAKRRITAENARACHHELCLSTTPPMPTPNRRNVRRSSSAISSQVRMDVALLPVLLCCMLLVDMSRCTPSAMAQRLSGSGRVRAANHAPTSALSYRALTTQPNIDPFDLLTGRCWSIVCSFVCMSV
jgi:hypothetical protein